MRRVGIVLASMVALGATVGFAGAAGADTNPNASDEACIGAQLSYLAQYLPEPDGTGTLGTKAWFYHAAAVDPEFWDQYGIRPGLQGRDFMAVYAKAQFINSDTLHAFGGCT